MAGRVDAYLHRGNSIGVLVELACESKAVAESAALGEFSRMLCLHVAASAPLYVRREDMPEAVIAAEMTAELDRLAEKGKPESVARKIAESRLERWLSTVCLEEQEYIAEPDRTISEAVEDAGRRFGESIRILRFARFVVDDDESGSGAPTDTTRKDD